MNFKCCHFYVLHHHLFLHITELYRSCGTNQCQGHRSDDSSQVVFTELCHTVILVTLDIGSRAVCTCLNLTFLLSLNSVSLNAGYLSPQNLYFGFYVWSCQRCEIDFKAKTILRDLYLSLLSWTVVQLTELDIRKF